MVLLYYVQREMSVRHSRGETATEGNRQLGSGGGPGWSCQQVDIN